jgi:hypothetical protein
MSAYEPDPDTWLHREIYVNTQVPTALQTNEFRVPNSKNWRNLVRMRSK